MGKLFLVGRLTLTEREYTELPGQKGYREFQYARAKAKLEEIEELRKVQDAKVRYLEDQLYGKKTKKDTPSKSETDKPGSSAKRPRGQQPGCVGHGRTQRPKKLFGNSQSTAVAPELRPCVTTGAKIASCSSLQSLGRATE